MINLLISVLLSGLLGSVLLIGLFIWAALTQHLRNYEGLFWLYTLAAIGGWIWTTCWMLINS